MQKVGAELCTSMAASREELMDIFTAKTNPPAVAIASHDRKDLHADLKASRHVTQA
jgi:hypothetical protein